MEHRFEVHVTQRHLNRALRRFILREIGWGTLVAVVVCLAIVGYDVSDGDLGYMSIALLTLILLLGVVFAAAFFIRKRQSAELLARLGGSSVSYRFDETDIGSETVLGSSQVKWEMMKRLWIGPDVTMLFYSKHGYTTIPTDQIPDDALDFLADQMRGPGGQILDIRA